MERVTNFVKKYLEAEQQNRIDTFSIMDLEKMIILCCAELSREEAWKMV